MLRRRSWRVWQIGFLKCCCFFATRGDCDKSLILLHRLITALTATRGDSGGGGDVLRETTADTDRARPVGAVAETNAAAANAAADADAATAAAAVFMPYKRTGGFWGGVVWGAGIKTLTGQIRGRKMREIAGKSVWKPSYALRLSVRCWSWSGEKHGKSMGGHGNNCELLGVSSMVKPERNAQHPYMCRIDDMQGKRGDDKPYGANRRLRAGHISGDMSILETLSAHAADMDITRHSRQPQTSQPHPTPTRLFVRPNAQPKTCAIMFPVPSCRCNRFGTLFRAVMTLYHIFLSAALSSINAIGKNNMRMLPPPIAHVFVCRRERTRLRHVRPAHRRSLPH